VVRPGILGHQRLLSHQIPRRFRGTRWVNCETCLTIDAGVRSLSQYKACPKFYETTDKVLAKVDPAGSMAYRSGKQSSFRIFEND
jgi:hypothetical protein